MEDLILRYITMPMAVKVLQDDKNHFQPSKVNVIYFNLIDSALEQIENDFRQLKVDMYSEYHLDIRYIGRDQNELKYAVNKSEIGFPPEKLRNKTEELMREYLSKVDFENEERMRNE